MTDETPEPTYDQAVGMKIFEATAHMFTRTIHQLPKAEADRLMKDLAAGGHLGLTVTFTKPVQFLVFAVAPDGQRFRNVCHFTDPDVVFDFNVEEWEGNDPPPGM